jgi:hypothetical protein
MTLRHGDREEDKRAKSLAKRKQEQNAKNAQNPKARIFCFVGMKFLMRAFLRVIKRHGVGGGRRIRPYSSVPREVLRTSNMYLLFYPISITHNLELSLGNRVHA